MDIIMDRICDDNEFQGLNFSPNELACSSIYNYFRGKVIFLTGGTGFLGQLYLEKLLRCDVKRVYVLARQKKNKSPTERLRKIFDGVQFSEVRKRDPDFLRRITVIEGDLSELGVGIEANDLHIMRENVEIIIHAAADVRFNEMLYDLVMTNLRGTREMLLLADTFDKLQVFAYVSTAYSHCPVGHHIFEKFYDPPIDPDIIIAYAEQCEIDSDEFKAFEILTELLIQPWPNTYSFSKSLSEELVRRFGSKRKCCVLRPSIIYSTYQEPVPGWTNNIYGINGVVASIASGLSRVLLRNPNYVIDIVCADFVVNATLAAIWATHETDPSIVSTTKEEGTKIETDLTVPKIYSISSSVDSPISVRELQPLLTNLFECEPSIKALWVICSNTTTSLYFFKYLSFFFHFLPFLIMDGMTFLMRKKTRLMPLMRRVQVFTISLSYFALHEWLMDNTNMRALIDRMSPIDKRLFMCDLKDFNFEHWSYTYLKGIQVFLLQDQLKHLPKARFRYRIMKFLHFFVCLAFYASQFGLIYVLFKAVHLV